VRGHDRDSRARDSALSSLFTLHTRALRHTSYSVAGGRRVACRNLCHNVPFARTKPSPIQRLQTDQTVTDPKTPNGLGLHAWLSPTLELYSQGQLLNLSVALLEVNRHRSPSCRGSIRIRCWSLRRRGTVLRQAVDIGSAAFGRMSDKEKQSLCFPAAKGKVSHDQSDPVN